MKKTTKILSVILVAIMIFSTCAAFSVSAAPKMKSIKVISAPKQVTFFRGTDWDYGRWDQPTDTGAWIWVENSMISFLRNPGSGYYKDAGMINAEGLVIEVTYSDGTKKTMTYKESKKSDGTYTQNIIISPEKGAYKVGKMKAEVWLEEDYRYYDTYEIELLDVPREMGDANADAKVNSADALLVLQHSVSLITLASYQKSFADMDKNGKYNSADALAILQIAVGNNK